MSIRLFTFAAILLAVFSNVSHAQIPALRYTFTKGKTLVYKQVFDQTDVQNGGQYEDSFVHTSVLRVYVENVDSAGNGMLLCEVLEQGYGRKNKGESTPELTLTDSTRFADSITSNPFEEIPVQQSVKLTTSRPDLPPKYRVTLSPRGEYLTGEILEKSESDKQFEERAKQPGVVSHRATPDSRLKHQIGQFFHPLPFAASVRIGETWADTTNKKEKITVIGGKYDDEPRYQLTIERHDHTVHADSGSFGSQCLILEEHMWKAQRHSTDTKERRWSSQEKYYLRADGVCLGKDILTTSKSVSLDDDGKDDPYYGKAKFLVSLRLLREE